MISTKMAIEAIAAAEKKANEIGVKITTCVVDEHGAVIALKRMDEALVISPKFAFAKAYTAAMLKIPTKSLGEYSSPNKPYYGLTSLFGGELTVIDGGIPVIIDSFVIGAVGVGGSADVTQDEQCADAAVSVLQAR